MKRKMAELIKKRIVYPICSCVCIWIAVLIYLIINSDSKAGMLPILILLSIQLISSISDLYNRTIPVKLIVPVLISSTIILIITSQPEVLVRCLLGMGTAFIVMLLLLLVSKGQIGGGDVILMSATGYFTGINTLFSVLFFAVILSGTFSLIIVTIKNGNKNSEIPFAPFVLIATSILSILI